MSNGSGSNSAVSIVAILAILVLAGLVLYFVLSPGDEGEFELEVNVDTISQVRMERPPPIPAPPAGTFAVAGLRG